MSTLINLFHWGLKQEWLKAAPHRSPGISAILLVQFEARPDLPDRLVELALGLGFPFGL